MSFFLNYISQLFSWFDQDQIFRFFGFLCWLLLLMIPIKRIDLSDVISCLMYMVFFCFSGVILILAIPDTSLSVTTNDGKVLLRWFSLFIVMSLGRWFLHKINLERQKMRQRQMRQMKHG